MAALFSIAEDITRPAMGRIIATTRRLAVAVIFFGADRPRLSQGSCWRCPRVPW